MDYRKKVLEHFGGTFDTEYQAFSKTYNVEYHSQTTADGYEVFMRSENGERRVNWDSDVFYYAESCLDSILEDIEQGYSLYVYDEIAEQCGLDEEGYTWVELYEKFIGYDN